MTTQPARSPWQAQAELRRQVGWLLGPTNISVFLTFLFIPNTCPHPQPATSADPDETVQSTQHVLIPSADNKQVRHNSLSLHIQHWAKQILLSGGWTRLSFHRVSIESGIIFEIILIVRGDKLGINKSVVFVPSVTSVVASEKTSPSLLLVEREPEAIVAGL
jgi:hypothetical protein